MFEDKLDVMCKALVVAKQGLRDCETLFHTIRGDWTDPRSDCREGWVIVKASVHVIDAALAKCVPPPERQRDELVEALRAMVIEYQDTRGPSDALDMAGEVLAKLNES